MTRKTSALAALLLAAALLAVSAQEQVSADDINKQEYPQHLGRPQQEDPESEEASAAWIVDTPMQLQPRKKHERVHRPVHPPGSITGPGPVQSTVPALYQPILDQHNTYRALHQAPPMQWDAALAAQTAAYAEKCSFEHGSFGENMYLTARTSNTAASLQNAVRTWYGEVMRYNFSQPGFTQGTGHFTQVVWKGSSLLGCAAHGCPGRVNNTNFQHGTLVICRYLPYGNILGRFAENVLAPVGLTEASATFISEGQTLHAPDCYASPNEKYLLCLRRDARLMLLHRTNTGNYTMWSSNNERKPASAGPMAVKLMPSGSLKVWDATSSVWSTNVPEQGAAPRRLALQNDGNLVLYDAHNLVLWHTNTAGMLDQFEGQLLT